ncbi:MAG: GAF domain-containing protein [Flavobacterium sp. JAD_PAG50586_2]|nr:MAG: GAF domain-containing protein [Flavobacterium sp. JAD_PAG50586_2]
MFLDNLETLTADNKLQQADVKRLKTAAFGFYRYLERRIQDKREGRLVMAVDLERGKKLMSEMRVYFQRMENREAELLKQRTETAANYGGYTSALIVAAALIAILISGIFFARILKDYRVRTALQVELEKKDRETAERIRVISNIASQIALGNYKTRVDNTQTDALGKVADSLNEMAQSLDESFTNLSDSEWLQSGVARLNNEMLGDRDIKELAGTVLDFIANYTGSQAGVFYLLQNENLIFTAGYGYDSDAVKKQLIPGEGLSGQAAASGKLLEIKTPEPDSIKISYALGEALPKHIVALPLQANGMVGVIEMATVSEYGNKEINFFEAMSKNIAIAFQVAQNRRRIQELLEETQSQSEELQTQHSELESMNAELEVQTEKLQASEEELKVQQEELQQTNEELNERSVLLEEQNLEIQKNPKP